MYWYQYMSFHAKTWWEPEGSFWTPGDFPKIGPTGVTPVAYTLTGVCGDFQDDQRQMIFEADLFWLPPFLTYHGTPHSKFLGYYYFLLSLSRMRRRRSFNLCTSVKKPKVHAHPQGETTFAWKNKTLINAMVLLYLNSIIWHVLNWIAYQVTLCIHLNLY